MKALSQIGWGHVVEGFIVQEKVLDLYFLEDEEPVELVEDRSEVVTGSRVNE